MPLADRMAARHPAVLTQICHISFIPTPLYNSGLSNRIPLHYWLYTLLAFFGRYMVNYGLVRVGIPHVNELFFVELLMHGSMHVSITNQGTWLTLRMCGQPLCSRQ